MRTDCADLPIVWASRDRSFSSAGLWRRRKKLFRFENRKFTRLPVVEISWWRRLTAASFWQKFFNCATRKGRCRMVIFWLTNSFWLSSISSSRYSWISVGRFSTYSRLISTGCLLFPFVNFALASPFNLWSVLTRLRSTSQRESFEFSSRQFFTELGTSSSILFSPGCH